MTNLIALAERWEAEGIRIAKGGIDRLGVRRADAETAAHCFTIAAALRASQDNGK